MADPKQYTPKFRPGQDVSYRATADIRAGRVVEVTGDTAVAEAAAGSTKTVGVSAFAVKAGELVTVLSGGVQRPLAAGNIAAGDRVAAGAAGTVATGTTATIGTAIAAAANGAQALVKLDK